MGTGARQDRGGGFHALRSALERRFLMRIKRATHRSRPRLITPEAKRVLVVAPHMDDEVIPCGGTLLLLAATGAELHVIYATDSSGPENDRALAERRRKEAQQVHKLMQFASSTELGYRDGLLHRSEVALANNFADELARLNPDLVFCPFPADAHSDHMSCASAFSAAAVRAAWKGEILAYEVWTPLWPNVAVDISAVAGRKETAIRLYASQIADRDYASASLGLNRFRGLVHGVDYAEAFFRCSPSEFAVVVSLLDRI